jgi:hypothetical protein
MQQSDENTPFHNECDFLTIIDSLPDVKKQEIAENVVDYGIKKDDPAWVLVQCIIDANKIREETKKLVDDSCRYSKMIQTVSDQIPSKVESGAKVAANTIREVLFEELNTKAKLISDSLVKNIRDVANLVTSASQSQRDGILDEWRSQLAIAAKKQKIKEALGAKVSFAGVLLICFLLGGGGLYLGQMAFGFVPGGNASFSATFNGDQILLKHTGKILTCPTPPGSEATTCLYIQP